MRRVDLICTEVPPEVVGGLGRYAERLLAALHHGGTPVVVYGATSSRAATGTEPAGDITLHRLWVPGTRNRLVRTLGLVGFNLRVAGRILRSRRAGSVVAVHDWMGCLAGILCALLGRRPVVFHVHTRELQAGPARRRSIVAAGIAVLETALARLARLVVVPSSGMRDDLAGRGWRPERLRVIPHGCEDPELDRLAGLSGAERDRLRAAVRRRYLPGGEDGPLIVYAGRLAPHKGVDTLLRAVPAVLARYPRARLVLIGTQAPGSDGNAEVARLIEKLGVAGRVHAGFRFLDPPEVFAHFLAADVCAFPSRYEPFGLVAVEAMALARPVVVGPGYSPEVAGDGAIRCRGGSPAELAEALLSCLDDPAAAARLARRGAGQVRQRYRWPATAAATLAAYAEAVAEPAGAGTR